MSLQIARIMMQHPMDVNRRDHNGRTFLSSLVGRDMPQKDMIEFLELMKCHGFQINFDPETISQNKSQEKNWGTPFAEVLDRMSRPTEVIKWFLKNGIDVYAPMGPGGPRIIDFAREKKQFREILREYYPELDSDYNTQKGAQKKEG